MSIPQGKFFITHSSKDTDFARRLADDLRAQGLDGFFDVYSIKPGDYIAERINHGLEECNVYIPVLSIVALNSPWCREEINAAISLSNEPGRNGRPRIITALAENCHSEMPVFLRSRLYINFTRRYKEALSELLELGFDMAPQKPVERVETRLEIEQIYSQGLRALLLGQWEQAVLAFRRVIAIDSYYRDAYLRLKDAEQLLVTAKGEHIPFAMKFSALRLIEPIHDDQRRDERYYPLDALTFKWESVGGLGGDECYLVSVTLNPGQNDTFLTGFGDQTPCSFPVQFTLNQPNRQFPNYGVLLPVPNLDTWVNWFVIVAKIVGQKSDKVHHNTIPLSPPSAKGQFLLKAIQ